MTKYIITLFQKFEVSTVFFKCFWKKSIMLPKAAFIWSKIH